MSSLKENKSWAIKLNGIIHRLPTNRFIAYEVIGIPSILFIFSFLIYDLLFGLDDEEPTSGSDFVLVLVVFIILWPVLYSITISSLLDPNSQIGSLWEGILVFGYLIIQTLLIGFGYFVYFRKTKDIKQYKLQRKDYQNNMNELEVKLTNGFYAGAIELIGDIETNNGAVLTRDERKYLNNKIEELKKYNFPSSSDMEAAKSVGFNNFDEWITAKSKGFTDIETYQKAMKGGFKDYQEYSRMVHLGFKTKEGYLSAKLEDDRKDIEGAYSEILEVFAPPIHLLRIAERLNKSVDYIYDTTLLLIERKLLMGKIHTSGSIDSKDHQLELTHIESKRLETLNEHNETNNPSIIDALQTRSECGNAQSIIARTCTACGKELPFCNLCKRGYGEREVTVSCKECENIFHRQHLLAFVQSKGQCPICSVKMTITQFDL
ncbi:MAG: hypothetical protein HeimC2_15730 [Candidatus Heimdallarchaeota archaeon LC_2]|nr:MAG: hypothetical protein HeimC2_15730 [Candidatus Heimdallarchaeota archaeon LC_2]